MAKIIVAVILLLLASGFVTMLYTSTDGYKARVRQRAERHSVEVALARGRAELTLQQEKWEKQVARESALKFHADNPPRSSLDLDPPHLRKVV